MVYKEDKAPNLLIYFFNEEKFQRYIYYKKQVWD